MRPLRVFVDTSVFGGMFDSEFDVDTRAFFDAVDAGQFRLGISEQVIREIEPAPKNVRDFFYAQLPEVDVFIDSLDLF